MKVISFLLMVFFLGSHVLAQEKLLEYRIECPSELSRGDTVGFVVILDIKEGFHINAPGYFDNMGAFPTDLEFVTPLPKGLTKVGNAQMMDMEGNVFGAQAEGCGVKLVQLFTIDTNVTLHEFLIKGALNYQICDMNSCYAPVHIPFESKIKISTKFNKLINNGK